MKAGTGRRERKKQQTREAIAEAATRLMVERGFADVTIVEIAESADVSPMTVYNYFPTKEDLILGQIEDHAYEPAKTVRSRDPGASPIAVLRAHLLKGIQTSDPATGVTGDPAVLAFRRLVVSTPSLRLGMAERQARMQEALAAELAEALGPAVDDALAMLAATQVVAVQQALAQRNLARVFDGADVKRLRPVALAEANAAFDLLEAGIGTLDWTNNRAI